MNVTNGGSPFICCSFSSTQICVLFVLHKMNVFVNNRTLSTLDCDVVYIPNKEGMVCVLHNMYHLFPYSLDHFFPDTLVSENIKTISNLVNKYFKLDFTMLMYDLNL